MASLATNPEDIEEEEEEEDIEEEDEEDESQTSSPGHGPAYNFSDSDRRSLADIIAVARSRGPAPVAAAFPAPDALAILPCFMYNAQMVTAEQPRIGLNLFEPRYRVMCARVKSAQWPPYMLFTPNFDTYEPAAGDCVWLIRIDRCDENRGGTYSLHGTAVAQRIISMAWTDPGTRGLFLAATSPLPAPAARARDVSIATLQKLLQRERWGMAGSQCNMMFSANSQLPPSEQASHVLITRNFSERASRARVFIRRNEMASIDLNMFRHSRKPADRVAEVRRKDSPEAMRTAIVSAARAAGDEEFNAEDGAEVAPVPLHVNFRLLLLWLTPLAKVDDAARLASGWVEAQVNEGEWWGATPLTWWLDHWIRRVSIGNQLGMPVATVDTHIGTPQPSGLPDDCRVRRIYRSNEVVLSVARTGGTAGGLVSDSAGQSATMGQVPPTFDPVAHITSVAEAGPAGPTGDRCSFFAPADHLGVPLDWAFAFVRAVTVRIQWPRVRLLFVAHSHEPHSMARLPAGVLRYIASFLFLRGDTLPGGIM